MRLKNYSILIFLLLTSFLNTLVAQKIDPSRLFFDEVWEPKIFNLPSAFTEKDLLASGNNAVITIYLNDEINKIYPTVLGMNTTFRSSNEMATNPTRTELYKQSGWKTYRYPAGSGSNEFFFDGNAPSTSELHKVKIKKEVPDGASSNVGIIDGTKSKNFKPSDFIQFKSEVNGEATVVVNYFMARYMKASNRTERVLKAAQYAAKFVKYMNVDNDANIKYWEIGNEIYGKWEDGFYVDGSDGDGHFIGEVTPTEYGEDLIVFAEEMKKIDPSIKIGAIILDNRMDAKDWNNKVIEAAKEHIDFLVVHNYFYGEKDSDLKNILKGAEQIGTIKTMVNDMTLEVGKPIGHYPLAMTEFNSRGKYNMTMVNAIFVTEVIGEMMRHGYGMSAKWVGEWKGPKTGSTDSFKGTIAVEDLNQADYTPRQAYMSYRYFESYFGDRLIGATSNTSGVEVFASRFSDNKIGVVIINETGSTQKVKVKIPDASSKNMTFGDAYWYEIYATSIGDGQTMNGGTSKFYINEETGTTEGGGPEDFANVKPYKGYFENNKIFEAHKYSINYIVIDVTHEDLAIDDINKIDIKIYPNPVGDFLRIDESKKIQSIRIVNMNGMVVRTIKRPKNNVDVSSLTPNQYIVEIRTSEGISISKMIKI
ncbi:MAG: T9SS type A sorting domain-containing protein [Flavobacteriales bacterium]|nr:T9SS type A sorting domain-containing protein [Flavobacteriales bacterium]